jgi:single-strand DNA-binding protein
MASGSVNKVILVGNLGRDAELRATTTGLEVISFSVATTDRRRDRDSNQWTDQTEWHRVKMFRDPQRRASTIHDYLKKGQKVYVEGRLQTRSWDDKDGQKRYATEIICDRVELLGRAAGGGGPRPDAGESYEEPPFAAPQPAGDADDDVPF